MPQTEAQILENLLGGYDPADHDIYLFDGFNDCLVGAIEAGGTVCACYDREKIIARLLEDGDMTREDAIEHISFNFAQVALFLDPSITA